MAIRADENCVNQSVGAMDTVGLKHSILSHSYNLCYTLVTENKLKDLSFPDLICS